MTWTTVPDLTSRNRLLLTALLVTVLSEIVIVLSTASYFQRSLGDTDDAVRILLVRELLQGHGWYHPQIMRLQAPWGALMHWSRILDGAIAALDWVFRLVLSPDRAEIATRIVWPLLWLYPAALATLILARRLGGSVAVISAATFIPTTVREFEAFRLGRVDHHNVQLVMGLIALTAAMTGRGRWQAGVIAGLAGAFGLAVGCEALPLNALVGAYFAFELLRRDGAARAARGYGLALAGGGVGFYLIQTPPSLWAVSVCDTIGANLVAALAIAGIGLTSASFLARSKPACLAVLAVAGLAAAGAYVAMDPACLHGPMGGVPPKVAGYIDKVEEMMPFWRIWLARGAWANSLVSGPIVALAAAPFLLRREERWKDPTWWLLVAVLATSFALLLIHVRMHPYANWLAMPVIGCLIADLAPLWRRFLVPTILAAVLASPSSLALAAMVVETPFLPHPSGAKPAENRDASEACYNTAAYSALARLPAGLILNDVDLGPFILDNTPHSVVAGPYHRLTRGMTFAINAFSAPPDQAAALVHAWNIAYVVNCPRRVASHSLAFASPRGLMAELDRGRTPDWLEPLSRRGDLLQIYRVKPQLTSMAPR